MNWRRCFHGSIFVLDKFQVFRDGAWMVVH